MNIAITGAGGHVGHRLARELYLEGHEVSALVHSKDRARILPDGVELYVGDVRDPDLIDGLVSGCQAVAHLAYGSNVVGKTVNIDATKMVYRRAIDEGCDAFAFTSTGVAHPRLFNSDRGKYARTKYEASQWLDDRDDDISLLVLYPMRVIGPGDIKMKRFAPYATVFSNRILFPPIYRFERKNYVHVDTVVESIVAGLMGEASGHWLISGENMTNREYFKLIAFHSPRSHIFLPLPGVKWWLPRALNVIGKLGAIPDQDYTKVHWYGQSVVLPSDMERTSPVPNKGVDSAVKESIRWYSNAGLL